MSQNKKERKGDTLTIGIMPSADTFKTFDRIRKLYIKPIRCGPHITLVKPFIEYKKFDQAKKILREKLKTIEPFKVVLKDFDFFEFKKQYTMFLKPDEKSCENLVKLQTLLFDAYPDCIGKFDEQEGGFQFHISMGNFLDKETLEKTFQIAQEQWKPFEFEVKEIYFFTKDVELNYQVRTVVPLGKTPSKPAFDEIKE